MKKHSKSKRHARRAAASAHRSHRPTQAYRSHVAAKSPAEIAQEGTAVSRLEQPAVETVRSEQNTEPAPHEQTHPDEGADI
jgi:hypothetical protein